MTMGATTTEFEKNKAQWVQQMTAKHDLLGEGARRYGIYESLIATGENDSEHEKVASISY